MNIENQLFGKQVMIYFQANSKIISVLDPILLIYILFIGEDILVRKEENKLVE